MIDRALLCKQASCASQVSPVSIYPNSSSEDGNIVGDPDSPSLCKSLGHSSLTMSSGLFDLLTPYSLSMLTSQGIVHFHRTDVFSWVLSVSLFLQSFSVQYSH